MISVDGQNGGLDLAMEESDVRGNLEQAGVEIARLRWDLGDQFRLQVEVDALPWPAPESPSRMPSGENEDRAGGGCPVQSNPSLRMLISSGEQR
jgi:hypothetical protein